MSELIDELKTAEAQATAKAEHNYLQLLRDSAAGKRIKAETAADILRAANKTADEFGSEVTRLQRRPILQKKLKDRGTVHKEMTSFPKKYDDLEQAFLAQRDAYEAQKMKYSEQYSALERQMEDIVNAEAELQASCCDASVLEREAEALQKLQAAFDRRCEVDKMEFGQHLFTAEERSAAWAKCTELTAKLDAIRAEKVHAAF